ncbi:M15 family metallopeptidase [Plantibacter sp. YIM 135249]|uniref:M15 family metallopeptidase n=1 Tax=Plantibacter sp. YIM 135249 TaxID=3423918 RepID=UPI003D34629A
MTVNHPPTHRRSVSPRVRRNRIIALSVAAGVLAILLVVLLVNVVGATGRSTVAATSTPKATVTPSPTPTPTENTPAPPPPPPAFDKSAFSLDDPTSPWVVLNKQRPLNPIDYTPPDLVDVPVAHTWEPVMRAEASAAVVQMFAAASSEAGLSLASNSAYRSYSTQVQVYNDDVAANGQAFADGDTARPGYSEHQTGWTMDIGPESGNCSLNACFGETPEGQWLVANAWRFGFLLRYPADKVEVTGFTYEPWHFRYIGVPLSTEMHNQGVTTLEEFFGLPAAPGY